MTSTTPYKRPSRQLSLESILENQDELLFGCNPSSSGMQRATSTAQTMQAEVENGREVWKNGESFVAAINRMLKQNQSGLGYVYDSSSTTSNLTKAHLQGYSGRLPGSAESDVRLPYEGFRATMPSSTRAQLASLRWTVEPELEEDDDISPTIDPNLAQIDTHTIRSSPPTGSSTWSSTPSPKDPLGDIVWPGRLSCPATATAAVIPSTLWLSDDSSPSTVTPDSSPGGLGTSCTGGVPLTARWGSPSSDESRWDPKDEINPNAALFFPYIASQHSLPQDPVFDDNGSCSQWENYFQAHVALTMKMCGLTTDSDDEEAGNSALNPAAEDFLPGWNTRTDESGIGGGVSLIECAMLYNTFESSEGAKVGDTDRFQGQQQGQSKRPRYKRVRTRPERRHG